MSQVGPIVELALQRACATLYGMLLAAMLLACLGAVVIYIKEYFST